MSVDVEFGEDEHQLLAKKEAEFLKSEAKKKSNLLLKHGIGLILSLVGLAGMIASSYLLFLPLFITGHIMPWYYDPMVAILFFIFSDLIFVIGTMLRYDMDLIL
jgi:hypothetical protein